MVVSDLKVVDFLGHGSKVVDFLGFSKSRDIFNMMVLSLRRDFDDPVVSPE